VEPVKILDRGEKTLRDKVIPLVKVLWENIDSLEITLEKEKDMRDEYLIGICLASKCTSSFKEDMGEYGIVSTGTMQKNI
jgi:hypothetical protein